ncbi:hypothetical protein EW146_g1419 [Bondarzewia mesenterica]|uniref:ThuA-like domain-containing protein n=1 Tax=Bondarzewia mesenterica TaxID=1095465 RepID=A0A4S4M3X8_9AGAM|nr:hypothetical protein EW146_g1419 [Bondarzewia mesenterica]
MHLRSPGLLSRLAFSTLAVLLAFLPIMRAQQSAPARGLIYSATADFRHDSIPTARDALIAQGGKLNVQFDATEDEGRFTDEGLASYDLLVFLMNTGEAECQMGGRANVVLNESGKAALQNYLDLGGNFVAIHSASDCLRNTTFYGNEVGAFFDYHPEIQNATVDVIDASHPNPGPRKYDQGSPHPTAWYQEHGAGVESGGVAGRSFYTSLGHLNETWQGEMFLAHVTGGISWALQSNTTRAFNASAHVGNAGGASSSTSGSAVSSTGTSSIASSSSESTSTSSPSDASSLAMPSLAPSVLCGMVIGLVAFYGTL